MTEDNIIIYYADGNTLPINRQSGVVDDPNTPEREDRQTNRLPITL